MGNLVNELGDDLNIIKDLLEKFMSSVERLPKELINIFHNALTFIFTHIIVGFEDILEDIIYTIKFAIYFGFMGITNEFLLWGPKILLFTLFYLTKKFTTSRSIPLITNFMPFMPIIETILSIFIFSKFITINIISTVKSDFDNYLPEGLKDKLIPEYIKNNLFNNRLIILIKNLFNKFDFFKDLDEDTKDIIILINLINLFGFDALFVLFVLFKFRDYLNIIKNVATKILYISFDDLGMNDAKRYINIAILSIILLSLKFILPFLKFIIKKLF